VKKKKKAPCKLRKKGKKRSSSDWGRTKKGKETNTHLFAEGKEKEALARKS